MENETQTQSQAAKNVAELNWKEVIVITALLSVGTFLGIFMAQKLT